MSKPTAQQVHIDQPLTNISIAYLPGDFIAGMVFPNVPVQKQSDKYFIYTKADWLRREAGPRAPGTRARRGDYGLSTAQYACLERAIAKGVPDEVVANADQPLRPLEDASRWCTNQLLLEVESDVQSDVFGTGWSSSATPSPLWSNNTSTPVDDVETARNSVVSSIGREANVGVMGRGLWRYIKQHPDIVERIKYTAGPTSPAIVTIQAVAALFSLDKLLIGIAINDTAAEGATSTLAYLWGSHMFVGYVARGPSLLEPSAGYVFTWQQRQASRFREDQERQDVVEVRMSWDTKLTATDAGYLIKSAA
ncbi:MAG TPA: hypothetical protein VJ754_00995 [Anaerolineae bacterium]|nr:hypothetical protein [Anaerolineae bacterium]